jgi:hypothetical protein
MLGLSSRDQVRKSSRLCAYALLVQGLQREAYGWHKRQAEVIGGEAMTPFQQFEREQRLALFYAKVLRWGTAAWLVIRGLLTL